MDYEVLKQYDELPEVYYVTDLETLEVIWINKIGKKLFSNLKENCSCYEYFYKLKKPCRHCKRDEFLNNFEDYLKGVREFNQTRSFNGLTYKQEKRTIDIDGRKCLLHRIYEVTDIVNNFKENSLGKELFEKLITDIINIDVTTSLKKQFELLLESTKEVFKADKVSLIKPRDEINFEPIFVKNDSITDFHYNPIFKKVISNDKAIKDQLNKDNYLIIYADEIGDIYPEIKEAMLKDGDQNFIMMRWMIDSFEYYLVIENSQIIIDDKKIFKLIYSYFFFTIKSVLNNDNLYRLSNIDKLSNLYNRNKFNNDLATSYTSPYDNIILMFVDLDNLKDINDNFGHSMGDKLIAATAKILREVFENCDIYRIGGDEFIVIAKGVEYDDFINLYSKMKKRFDLGKIYHSCGISYRKSNGIISEMLVEAEKEMYIRKRRHHDAYDNEQEREAVVSKIKMDIKNEHFYLVLQPKINPYTNQVVGAEALVRGKSDGVWQAPNEFIPLFEKNNCVDLIDYYVLEEVIKLQRNIIDKYGYTYPISVNISKLTLLLDSFEPTVINLLNEYKVPISMIRLEVTEKMDVSSEDILSHGYKLRQYGLLLEVDDFGSHFTNLNFLNKDVFSVVKLDRYIFSKLKADSITKRLIDVMIEECHKKDMIILAEGVETENELNFVKELGVDEVQGYYYDHPMSIERFIKKYIEIE